MKMFANQGHMYLSLKYSDACEALRKMHFCDEKASKGNGFLWNGIRSEEQRAKGFREKNFSYRMQGNEIEQYPGQKVLP